MRNLLLFFALSSCATNGFWYKQNSSQEELSKVKYLCLKESQQPKSYSYYNNGFDNDPIKRSHYESSSGMITNYNLFNACMNSHGFYWKIIEAKIIEAQN
jgi:hypothetical protein